MTRTLLLPFLTMLLVAPAAAQAPAPAPPKIWTVAASAGLALTNGNWVVMRVPYPLGFYTKWMDGRIDDASRGWKGRGLWATISTRAPFHMEGGKGTTSKVMQFQVRPDPLAK